jgi:hypothetical protein
LGAGGTAQIRIDAVRTHSRGDLGSNGYVDYERRWNRSFLSTVSFGIVAVNNLDIQSGDALHRTQRGAASMTWNPVPRADVIFEVLFGERVNKDGEHNGSSQIQAGWKLRF